MPRPARSRGHLGVGVLVDERDGVLDGQDLLGGIVGYLAAELFLERHDELDRVEAVRAEIVDEAGVVGDLVLVHAEMLDDDLLYTISCVTHARFPWNFVIN